MCIEIEIDGANCETVGELRKHIAEIVYDANYKDRPYADDTCLCCIDVDATAKANGYAAIDQCGFMEFLFKENG